MVNLEAAACGTPVILSHERGLSDWEHWGNILIDPSSTGVARALSAVTSWSEEEREERGARAREMIVAKYSDDVIGRHWLTLYGDLVN